MVIYCRSVAMLVHSGRLFNDDPSPSLHTCIHPHVGADIHTLTFVSKNTAPHPFLHSHINAHKLNTTHSWVSLTMACIIYGLSVSDMRPKQMNWGGGWILTCPQLKDPATAFDALCRSDRVGLALENLNFLQMLAEHCSDKPVFIWNLPVFCAFIFRLFYLDGRVMNGHTKLWKVWCPTEWNGTSCSN